MNPGNATTSDYSQQFASYLYGKWIGQGDCDDGNPLRSMAPISSSRVGLVIFYSKADARLAVRVGDGLRHVMTNATIDSLVATMQTRMKMKCLFCLFVLVLCMLLFLVEVLSASLSELDAGAYDAAFLLAFQAIDRLFAILRYEIWILYAGVILIIVIFFLAFIFVTRSYKSVIEYHTSSRCVAIST
jgi:hypothetical protein